MQLRQADACTDRVSAKSAAQEAVVSFSSSCLTDSKDRKTGVCLADELGADQMLVADMTWQWEQMVTIHNATCARCEEPSMQREGQANAH